MRKHALTLFAAAVLHSPAWAAEAPPLAEVSTVAGGYAKELKAVLQEQIKKNGLEGGTSACSEKALQIGAQTARRTGWSVRRVSTKARNPLDMPDAYEQATLAQFEKDIAGGKQEPGSYEVVSEGGVRYARLMKAIRIEPVCLGCHGGTEVVPGVEKKLSMLYPHDAARGYRDGDLRGAVSIKIKLD